MTITWPPPLSHQAILRLAGFEFAGEHGRFAFAWLQRGPVALIEYFVIRPELRGSGYLRVALDSMVEFLRQRGVRFAVGYASETARLWRRMGVQVTEPGWLLLRVGNG